MPVYKGRRRGTYRVTLFARSMSEPKARQHEWIVDGTRKEAEAYEARKRLELDAGAQLSSRVAPPLLDFCLKEYEPHARRHLRESTWVKVRVYQIATLCARLGHLSLTEITTQEVEKYKAGRHREVKATSVNNELRVLSTVLKFAADMGFPTAAPKIKRLPVRGAGRVHAWTAEQIKRLITIAPAEIAPMLVFLANTGCRKGEAIACEWSWIDIPRRMIRIPSNDVWRPKSGKPREVPMSSSLAIMLDLLVSSGGRFVFPSRLGGRYTDFPKEQFNTARAAAGLTGGPHTLRHSFASMFLAKCPDMFLLAQILGHSHSRVTELYSHLLPEHLERARNVVDLAPAPTSGGPTGAEMATRRNKRQTGTSATSSVGKSPTESSGKSSPAKPRKAGKIAPRTARLWRKTGGKR